MTNAEKQKIYAALSAPFPEEAIERTDGRVTGRGYSTTGIKAQYIVNRLNEVLGLGNWRVHRTVNVRPITTAKGRPAFEAVCDVTLEFGEWTASGFVAWAESLADGGHSALSEADARKGALTNAIKRAAAFLGCGRQAYEGTIDEDHVPTADADDAPPPATRSSAPTRDAAPVPQQNAPTRNRLTSKQLQAIWSMAKKLGLEAGEFRRKVRERYSCQPEFLSRQHASEVISQLTAQLGGGPLQPNGHANGHAAREPGVEG